MLSRLSRRRAKLLLYTLLVALILYVSTLTYLIPSTDDFSPYNPLWNGMSIFTNMFSAMLTPASKPPSPRNTVVFVVGASKSFSETEARLLKEYVVNGGLLVVLEDYGSGIELLKLMGVPVVFHKGVVVDPLYKHRCSRLPEAVVTLPNRNYTLVLNYAATLEVYTPCRCIGFTTPFSFLDTDGDTELDPGEPQGPLCIAALCRLGKGSILVVSDASIVVNSMIGLRDNLEFIKSLISGRTVYIVSDKWVETLYTRVRQTVYNSISVALSTWLRYPIAAVAVSTAWVLAERLTALVRGGQRAYIEEVLVEHPDWDPEIVKHLVKELGPRESD